MSAIKQGRKPLSERTKPGLVNADDIFNNPLSLDPKITEVIESKDHSYRFINYKKFVEMGGQHEAHWVPIKRSKLKEWGYDNISTDAFLSGADADGYIRRQDLVLAVRPKSITEQHKRYLRQEAERVQHLQTIHAEELRSLIGGRKDMKVYEGYEEDEK